MKKHLKFITNNDNKIIALEVTESIELWDLDNVKRIKNRLEKINQIRANSILDLTTEYENDVLVIEALNNYLLSK